MQHVLKIHETSVKVSLHESGKWTDDKVLIYEKKATITEALILSIIQYLYDEGYIVDRRTNYEIIKLWIHNSGRNCKQLMEL